MKKLSIIVIAFLAIISTGFTVSMLWNVSNEGVTINFELPDEGTKGTLSGLKAVIDFDKNDLSTAKISASVDIQSLNTGNEQKDNHLKSADFFNAEKYPVISYESTSIKATETGFVTVGNLTMKDSVKVVEIPFTFSEENGGGVFKGTMEIHPGDFGVTKKSKSGKDKVVVTISVPVKK